MLSRRPWAGLALLLAAAAGPEAAAAAAPTAAEAALAREARCLAMVAYAEAAGEGRDGMAAVVAVMRNRQRHPSFPKDACAVALQPGQFQPVGERPALKRALRDPLAVTPVDALGGPGAVHGGRLAEATLLALAEVKAGSAGAPPRRDPTRGALFFVNPRFMDPTRCPWFAGLKPTGRIGAHVFMTHYKPGERRGAPALDCAASGGPAAGAAVAALPRLPAGQPGAKPPAWALAGLDLALDPGAHGPAADPSRAARAKLIGAKRADALARDVDRKLDGFRIWHGADGRIRVILAPPPDAVP